MAVIQDLPAELLRRILELVMEQWDSEDTAQHLCRTSLVSRAWRNPSQALLLYDLNPYRSSFRGFASALRLNLGCTLQMVTLDFEDQKIMRALGEHEISVGTLHLYHVEEQDLDMSQVSVKLFTGLKSLHIEGNFKGRPTLLSHTTLELTQLGIDAECLPSLPFLDSILPAAPYLTCLNLEVRADGDVFPREYTIRLQPLLSRLRRLILSDTMDRDDPGRASLDVTRFVASCTALKSLELFGCGAAWVKDAVTALRAPLSVLETYMPPDWKAGGGGVATLVSILELPAVAALIRWRINDDDDDGGGKWSDEERGQWEAACRTRGIEPREERRFFTDYPAE